MLLGVLAGGAVLLWNGFGGHLPFIPHVQDNDPLGAAARAFQQGDLNSTVDNARRALERNPDDAAALTLLARALIYRSYSDYNHAADRDTALELTTTALSRQPANPDRRAIHAYALQAAGQPVEAAQIAESVLRDQPQNGLARVARALAYGSVGNHDIALRESQKAAEQPEWGLESQRAIAISYSDLGQYQKAIDAVERAIRYNRYLPVLYFERALYALQMGDTDSATAAYFQILTYDPQNVKSRLRLCELSSLLRERDKAITYCGDVTTRAPEWSDGWYQLGREYFLQGDFAAAQAALHRCSTLQVLQNVPVGERRFECWYLQGQSAEIMGDCPALIATYNEFRSMAADATVQETWVYPPEGPPGCAGK
jgi:tetratricopeptide (TPR) repeat protein